ncbi:MAG: elongation factor P [Rickettsiales bacterium]|nr:MAG: elongation factor P [Rickettsiales bacterium]
MKISANLIRAGNVIKYTDKLYIVSKTPSWSKPGKGGAFVQVEMKDIYTGNKLNERFRSTEDVERAQLDQKKYQFLYNDDDMIILMDLLSYEQIQISSDLLGDKVALLQDEMELTIESYENPKTGEFKIINIILPDIITVTVESADAVIKGQTATSSYKPATVNGGIKIMVPPFIELGTKIVVKTEDSTYVERFK